MRPEAVIFDIGNVLIEWRPERQFDARIGAAARRELFAEVDLHTMNDEIDRGGDLAEIVARYGVRHPRWADQIRVWQDDWPVLAGPEIPHAIRLLDALRAAGIPVFALSNFGIATFAVAEPDYPVLGRFDRRYISGHMGMAKPDAAIYAAVEADCGVAPGRLLFTDDRADNIAAAAARGWQTHLFDGPEGLAARLVADGLLSPEAAR
ncbi:HAD family hydrolase [Roseivivax sp. CAU 1761]